MQDEKTHVYMCGLKGSSTIRHSAGRVQSKLLRKFLSFGFP